MKTIYIFRHAKSSWEFTELSDAERPLIATGVERTKKVIKFLRKREVKPQLFISSPAFRAYETARLVAEGLGYPLLDIQVDTKVYERDYEYLLTVIYGLKDELESVIIFGHNPAMTMLTNLFARPEIDNLPTSGVSCFTFETDKWEEISSAEPVTEFIVFPKMLK
jgi:phosphohistidine phosphatase